MGALVVLGYLQSKDRETPYYRAFGVSYILFFLSLYSVLSTFGFGIALLFWFIGSITGIAWGLKLEIVHAVVYLAPKNAFILKGSWWWMVFILLLFSVKYTTGVMIARQIEFSGYYEGLIGLIYGCISGVFFARIIVLKRLKVKSKNLEVQNGS